MGTPLHELWIVFRAASQISPRDLDGLLTLSGIGTYLETCPPLNVTHDEFWMAMLKFLDSTNQRIIQKRNQNRGK